MPIDPQIHHVLRQHFVTPSSSFSIGSLGAIAEFHREPDEPLVISELEKLTIATDRGALSLKLVDNVRPLAYESLSKRKNRWQHGVVFCLPHANAVAHCRSVLTELGPDQDAVRSTDRHAVLFDVGLGAPNVDFCVRTFDPKLISILRRKAGQSVLEPSNPVLEAIIRSSPHRIAISKLGRLEVYQTISTSKTPSGPHTHVLPNLLASGLTHARDIPVPNHFTPCLSLYPANPVVDSEGRDKPFEPESFEAFSMLLEHWGDPEYRAEKAKIWAAIRDEQDPDSYNPSQSLIGRKALKIVLRQLRQSLGDTQHVLNWCSKFDT